MPEAASREFDIEFNEFDWGTRVLISLAISFLLSSVNSFSSMQLHLSETWDLVRISRWLAEFDFVMRPALWHDLQSDGIDSADIIEDPLEFEDVDEAEDNEVDP